MLHSSPVAPAQNPPLCGLLLDPLYTVYLLSLVQLYIAKQSFSLPLISACTTSTPLGRNPPPATMAPRGKKPGPPKKDGRQPESLTDTPPLKGKPPVTKTQLKKKTPATGDSEGPPLSLASGASPAPQPPHSYATAARSSMDTSEPMDIKQLCAMRPQCSGTPPAVTNAPLLLLLWITFPRLTSLSKASLPYWLPRMLQLYQLLLPVPLWLPQLQAPCRLLQKLPQIPLLLTPKLELP